MGEHARLLMFGVLLLSSGCIPPLTAEQGAFFKAVEKGKVDEVRGSLNAQRQYARDRTPPRPPGRTIPPGSSPLRLGLRA
jgi:hypothetical protein